MRFACDISIGVDFFLAETRALETLNFLLVSARNFCIALLPYPSPSPRFPFCALRIATQSLLFTAEALLSLPKPFVHCALQALAQKAQGQTGGRAALESGCLGYIEWSSGSVVVVSDSKTTAQRSGARLPCLMPPPLLLLLLLLLWSAVVLA